MWCTIYGQMYMYLSHCTYMCTFKTCDKLVRDVWGKKNNLRQRVVVSQTQTNRVRRNTSNLIIRPYFFCFVCLFDLSCSVFYFPWPMRAMRHHWLLLGACGWVLLILMFVSKLITFRAVDGKTSPCRVPSELPEDSRTPLTLSHTTLSLCLYRLR